MSDEERREGASDEAERAGGDGVSRLLAAAGLEPQLAEELSRDPLAAAHRRGVELSASERALLRALPPAALRRMVGAVARALPDFERREIVVGGAALAGALLAGGCPAPTGSRPDPPPPRHEGKRPAGTGTGGAGSGAGGLTGAGSGSGSGSGSGRPHPTRGIRPDRPPAPTGIRPDRPPRKHRPED